jgi:hypothetical protein
VAVQNCGGGAAIAGTRALRVASAITIDSNRAGGGGGGAVCVIADSELAADASAGRAAAAVAVLGSAAYACLGGGGADSESSMSVKDATIPFMVALLTGAVATVSFNPARRLPVQVGGPFAKLTGFLTVAEQFCCRRRRRSAVRSLPAADGGDARPLRRRQLHQCLRWWRRALDLRGKHGRVAHAACIPLPSQHLSLHSLQFQLSLRPDHSTEHHACMRPYQAFNPKRVVY